MSQVRFRIVPERYDLMSYPSDVATTPEERIVGDPQDAAEIAVEMANRPGESGVSVIVGVDRLGGPIRLALIEPGDSIAWVERELR